MQNRTMQLPSATGQHDGFRGQSMQRKQGGMYLPQPQSGPSHHSQDFPNHGSNRWDYGGNVDGRSHHNGPSQSNMPRPKSGPSHRSQDFRNDGSNGWDNRGYGSGHSGFNEVPQSNLPHHQSGPSYHNRDFHNQGWANRGSGGGCSPYDDTPQTHQPQSHQGPNYHNRDLHNKRHHGWGNPPYNGGHSGLPPSHTPQFQPNGNSDGGQSHPYTTGVKQNPIFDNDYGDHQGYPSQFGPRQLPPPHTQEGYVEGLETYGTDLRKDVTIRNVFKVLSQMLSACFIIGDLVMDWLQLAEWEGVDVAHSNAEKAYENLRSYKELKCMEANASLISFYKVSCSLGTVFAVYQLINIVGETIMDFSDSGSTKCKGFQILHGWTESAISVFFVEIPQAILVFAYNCKYSRTATTYAVVTTIIGNMKNIMRKITCKQKKQYWAECCRKCKRECECRCKCEYVLKCDCILLCRTFTYTVCGSGKCCVCETEPLNVCGDCFWNRTNYCCGAIENDPKWAERYFHYGSSIHEVTIGLLIIYKYFLQDFISSYGVSM